LEYVLGSVVLSDLPTFIHDVGSFLVTKIPGALPYVIGFVVLLGVLIFVHELGHFLIAKILGVKVLKFSMGFPPAMIKRQWGETEYILSWIPLGGYVKLLGEDPDSQEEIPPEELPRAFTVRPLSHRFAIVLAGPVFNYLSAVLIICAGYLAGWPVLASELGKIYEGTPAMEAGFKAGDNVVAINGQRIWRWDDMRSMIEKSPGKQVTATVERDHQKIDLVVTPSLSNEKDMFGEPAGRIVVSPSGKMLQLSAPNALHEGLRYSAFLTKMVVETLVKLVTGSISPQSVGGPILIIQASGESLKSGLFSFIFLMSFISINLAIINLLPIPILDGGHLMFFIVEGIIRRPVTGKIREVATQVGVLFLVFIFVLVFYNDISRIVTKGWTLAP
jgi:regulator of sigma E protease